MRIAIEATCLRNRRGYGRHARALFGALVAENTHRYTFVTDEDPSTLDVPAGAEVLAVHNAISSSEAIRAGGRRSLASMWRMSKALSRPEFEAVVFPSVFSYVPVWSRASKIVFQHDVIAETFPELTTPALAERCFWWMKCTAAQWQAERLVTVSEYSRVKIAERLGWPASRIAVVGEAPAPVFRKLADPRLTPRLEATAIDWSRPMFVFVGGFSPHKNLPRLVEAFSRVVSAPPFQDLQLVLVGETRSETFLSGLAALRHACSQYRIEDRTVFTGFLPDEDLTVLLNRATALVLPSLMEGYGLPAVEAAACGAPVIATKESPLPGILGDAGIYVSPGNTEEIAEALRLVAGSALVRARMREGGIAACAVLNWPTQAKALLRLIAETKAGTREALKGNSTSWARI